MYSYNRHKLLCCLRRRRFRCWLFTFLVSARWCCCCYGGGGGQISRMSRLLNSLSCAFCHLHHHDLHRTCIRFGSYVICGLQTSTPRNFPGINNNSQTHQQPFCLFSHHFTFSSLLFEIPTLLNLYQLA
jgi:hypothetical protein